MGHQGKHKGQPLIGGLEQNCTHIYMHIMHYICIIYALYIYIMNVEGVGMKTSGYKVYIYVYMNVWDTKEDIGGSPL